LISGHRANKFIKDGGAMNNIRNCDYTDRDDALHFYPGDKYFEWWYLDAQFDNGYSCVVTFHYRILFMAPHIPAVQLHIYAPDGQNYMGFKAYDEKDVFASDERCDVKMGDSYVRQENGVYKLYFRTKRAGAELTFRNLLPGWKSGNGLYKKGDNIQGWVVPVPRGDVEGTLWIGETPVKVKGNRGYHDHNWGSTNIDEAFYGWYWGRLYDEKYTLIYGWCFPQDKHDEIAANLYLAREDKPLLGTSKFKLKQEKLEIDEELERKYARSLKLSGGEDGIKLDCTLNTRSVVEKLDMAKAGARPIYYWRFLADYDARFKSHGLDEKVTGKTLHEYMLLR